VERVPVRPTRYHLIFLRNCLLNFASRLALHAMWPVPQFTKESRREFLTWMPSVREVAGLVPSQLVRELAARTTLLFTCAMT
jgi:hypothetical protein